MTAVLLLLAMALRCAAQTDPPTPVVWFCGAGPAVGKACKLQSKSSPGEIEDMKTTVCILSPGFPATPEYNAVNYQCADVCDITLNTTAFIIAIPGDAMADQQNNAFIQMVAGVRGGNNGNVQCKYAPAAWKAANHDWCKPGRTCDPNALPQSSLMVTVDESWTGRCVVNAGGPGGRICQDICDRSKTPEEFGEGARAGVVEEVTAARSDGTCANHAALWWGLGIIVGLVVCVGGIILLIVVCRNIRSGKKNATRGRGSFDPALDMQGPIVDQAELMPDPRDAQPPPMAMLPEEASYAPQYHEQPAQQQTFFTGLGEPKLQIPQLQPPPGSFPQVQTQPMYQQSQYANVQQPNMQYAATPQYASQNVQYAANPMSTHPPAAWQGGQVYTHQR